VVSELRSKVIYKEGGGRKRLYTEGEKDTKPGNELFL